MEVNIQTRYRLAAAHVIFLHYIQPLQSKTNQWADYPIEPSVKSDVTWTISSLYITWSPNWYGNWTRIQSMGPFRLN